MEEQKPRPYRFTEAVSDELNDAFQNLAAAIMKGGALSSKEKSVIALACAVALKCEQCVKAHKRVLWLLVQVWTSFSKLPQLQVRYVLDQV